MKILILLKCRNSRVQVPKVALFCPHTARALPHWTTWLMLFLLTVRAHTILCVTDCERECCSPRKPWKHAQCVSPVWPSCFLFLPNSVPPVASCCTCCKLWHLPPSAEKPLLWNTLIASLFLTCCIVVLHGIQAVLFLSIKCLFMVFFKINENILLLNIFFSAPCLFWNQPSFRGRQMFNIKYWFVSVVLTRSSSWALI